MTPYNRLPIVVTAPGSYETRSGNLVVVHEVKDHSDDYNVTRFNVKGNMYIAREGKRPLRRNNIWHESGMIGAIAESPNDIVRKLP